MEHEHFTALFKREPMHIKEARGLCKVVRALASRPECWDKRHLLLGDNLSLCLSASKGRCVQPLMLMIFAQDRILQCGMRAHPVM